MRSLREIGGDAAKIVLAGYSRAFSYEKGKPLPEKQLKFLSVLVKKYGKVEDLQTIAGNYDAVYAFAEGIRRAGSTDSGKVKAALETIRDFEGMGTRISFTPDDHDAYKKGKQGFTIVYASAFTKESLPQRVEP